MRDILRSSAFTAAVAWAATTVVNAGPDLIVRAGAAHSGPAIAACDAGRHPCEFEDARKTNRYVVTDATLTRREDGREVYRLSIAGGVVRATLAAISHDATALAILLVQESIATGSLFAPGSLPSKTANPAPRQSPGAFAPDTVHRQYTLSIRNPKSGDQIKAIDLGFLKPDAVALTGAGEYVWIAGEELQLRRREVRAYNTRSGKLEHLTALAKNASIRLYDDGFDANGVSYAAETAPATAEAGAVRKHLSANPYSIAEFSVKVQVPLSVASYASDPIAIVSFEGQQEEVRDLLESALAVKLAGAGLTVVERKRIKELLQEAQFQNLGLTDSKSVAEIGRLANAKYLAFGTVRAVGSTTLIALRLVGVEDGTQRAAAQLECRDCTPDDYLQGLGFLATDWITPLR